MTDETCNLTQTTQMVETAAGDLGNVCLRRELSVQLDAKIANRLHWLDDVGADCQVQLTFTKFTFQRCTDYVYVARRSSAIVYNQNTVGEMAIFILYT